MNIMTEEQKLEIMEKLTHLNAAQVSTVMNEIERVAKPEIPGEWLNCARYKNQSLLIKLNKKKDTVKKYGDEWKIFSVLVGTTFSLWRAVPLCKDRDKDEFKNRTFRLLEMLIADNAITFSREKELSEWMLGYYMRNAYLRLLSVQPLMEFDDIAILDQKIIDGKMGTSFTESLKKTPRECWDKLHTLSFMLFNQLFPDDEGQCTLK